MREKNARLANSTLRQIGKSIAVREVRGNPTAADEEQIMLRRVGVFLIFLTMFPAFGQSTSKYQVGTITEVRVHHSAGSDAPAAVSYDVSVKVGNAVYGVLYPPPLGEETVKYAAGRDLLVLVGKSTITYNDILGRSFAVPIESQKPAAKLQQSKQ